MNQPANHGSPRQDLGDVMRLALMEERKNREALLAELTSTRNAANSQQLALSNREAQIRAFEEQLQLSEQQTRHFEQEQSNLQAQLATAQTNVQNLNQQLHATAVETVLSKEERAARQAEEKKQLEKIQALQARLSDLQNSNQTVLTEKERLANQLEAAEAEKQAAAAQLAQAQEEVAVQRKENANLAEGVKTLAASSSALTQEIREEHPLAANAIFDDVVSNRATADFTAHRAGFFGQDVVKSKQARTVLVTDGAEIFALCHVHDTPLALWNPGTDWHEVSADLTRGSISVSPSAMLFSSLDPRIVLLPVSHAEARRLGGKIYRIATNDYQFQDTVVVGTTEDYYGECNFQIDLSAPMYWKMDRHTLNGLFGKFNPSSGDLVFSKSGDFLGIMVNNVYCARIRNEDATARISLGARDPGRLKLSPTFTRWRRDCL